MKFNKKQKDELKERVLREIKTGFRAKEKAKKDWTLNKKMLDGEKIINRDGVSDVNIAMTSSNSHKDSWLSKIGGLPKIQFVKTKEADLQRVQNLNALKDKYSSGGLSNWADNDRQDKNQAFYTGRAVTFVSMGSVNGKFKFKPEMVHVNDFYIDPNVRLSEEEARFLGRKGVRKTVSSLKKELKKSDSIYDRKALRDLINRYDDKYDSGTKDVEDNEFLKIKQEYENAVDGVIRFHEHWTYVDGERHYVLYCMEFDIILRIEKMSEMTNIKYGNKEPCYPFITWAPNPEYANFWSTAPLTLLRQLFLGQDSSINSLFENAKRINNPSAIINTEVIGEKEYRKLSKAGQVIKGKSQFDIKNAFDFVQTPSITTPIETYRLIEGIKDLESGIGPSVKGMATEDKVGIYEGNKKSVNQKLKLIHNEYARAYNKLAYLFMKSAFAYLNTETAIQIIGNDGIEHRKIKNTDIESDSEYNMTIISTIDELTNNDVENKNKLTFIQRYQGNPDVNQKALIENEAKLAGWESEEIKTFLDPKNEADAKLLAECARDIEALILGKEEVEPNIIANMAYLKKVHEYMRDEKENMDEATWMRFNNYFEKLVPIVEANIEREDVLYPQMEEQNMARNSKYPADYRTQVSGNQLQNELIK